MQYTLDKHTPHRIYTVNERVRMCLNAKNFLTFVDFGVGFGREKVNKKRKENCQQKTDDSHRNLNTCRNSCRHYAPRQMRVEVCARARNRLSQFHAHIKF